MSRLPYPPPQYSSAAPGGEGKATITQEAMAAAAAISWINGELAGWGWGCVRGFHGDV